MFKIIFGNEIVIGWIAPIITAIIASWIGNLFYKRKKSINIINTINTANKRLIDTVRPFFIQKFMVKESTIIEIRNSIIREYNVDNESIYNIPKIKENLVLDISETRFLDEDKKYELINFIDDVFNGYKEEKVSNLDHNYEMIKIMMMKKEISRYEGEIIAILPLMVIFISAMIQAVKNSETPIYEAVKFNDMILIIAIFIAAIGITWLIYKKFLKK